MHSPQFLTLATILLGVSSSTSASPAPSSSSTLSVSTSSDTRYGAPSYLHNSDYHYRTTSPEFARSGDIIAFPDNDFEAGCRFTAQGRAYNLCGLRYLKRIVEVGAINDEGLIPKRKGKERQRESEFELKPCPKGVRTCFIGQGTWSSRVTSAEKNIKKGSSSVSSVFVGNFRSAGRRFDLWINSERTNVRIILTCSGEDELGYEKSGDFDLLRWRTPHACPLGSPDGFRTTEAEEEDPTSDDDSKEESPEGDFKEDGVPVGISRQWMIVIVLLVACTLIGASVLISSPHARHYVLAHIQSAGYSILPLLTNLKQLTRPVAKHFPNFKVGERSLVRWAQEDMTLDGDEDFMVNGSNEGPQGWGDLEVVDEYIPLKSSPVVYAHSRTATGNSPVSASWNYSTYGSVPFEGMDVDESDVDMGSPPEGGMKRFIRTASETATTKVKRVFKR